MDVNLTPEWVEFLTQHGHEAVYWVNIGKANATDKEIFAYATEHGYTIFTNDLDFGTILFVSGSRKPSVIQIRGGWPLPEDAGIYIVNALVQFKEQLEQGALLVITEDRSRIRLLPIVSTGEKAAE